MLRNLFLAAASAFALGSGSVMAADDYVDGLKMGGLITSCQYYLNDAFKNPQFGSYMVREQYQDLSSAEQRAIIKIWNEKGSTKCVHATHGHTH